MTAPAHRQSDGRKPLPHIITAIISVALSLGGAHYLVHGQPGAAGTTTVVTRAATNVGVCAYFGPDASTGKERFQLSAPGAGGTCTHGVFVSAVPGR